MQLKRKNFTKLKIRNISFHIIWYLFDTQVNKVKYKGKKIPVVRL